ncbi:MAG TPA: FecR domain-containing protein [Tepidisphaeraceae bacterium]|jgi:hypothetical protein
MPPEDPLRDEITALADALLEGRLGPADARRLEELVCTNEEAGRIYFHYMHMVGGVLPRFGVQPPTDWIDQEQASAAAPPDVMSDTLIMPALREEPGPVGEPSIVMPPAAPPRSGTRAVALRRYAAAAAILVAACVALGLYWGRVPRTHFAVHGLARAAPVTQPPAVRPLPSIARPQPVAHLTALADAVIDDPALRRPGAPLMAGRVLKLSRGAAEVTCEDGTVLVIEGPASVRMIDPNTVGLDQGKLCARVPHQAARFHVTSSKLTVTDLGTEFGVDVGPDGNALTHVFEGRVSVAAPDPAKSGAPAVRLFERDQTARCPVGGGQIESVSKLTETFTRNIAQYVRPLPLHNTGMGIAEGQPDPHWQFVRDDNDPNLVPRAAIVAKAPPIYLPNTASSRWISTAGKLGPMHVGTYTFRTQFELTGMDPATARILARIAADDVVNHVRLNGREVPLPPLENPKDKYTRFHDFAITDGFIQGTNTLEVDVFNELDKMALRVEWTGTASAQVIR